MPVVSPSRFSVTTTSSLSGSYRSTLTSSSSLEKPYYRSSSSGTYVSSLRNSYGDRTTEYRSRYCDVDGRRERKTSLVEHSRTTRATSVSDSDSGISNKYRFDRSESRTRDVSTSRSDSDKANDQKTSKKSFLNSSVLATSPADFYNKYSPSNYVPTIQRIQQKEKELARSKSTSTDIGRPPASEANNVRKARNIPVLTVTEKTANRRHNSESSSTPGHTKKSSLANGFKDDNGNEVQSVSEIKKRFDSKMAVTKLPTNDSKLSNKTYDRYLSQLKTYENGATSYSRMTSKDERPVPVHLPHVEKNGSRKWEFSSSSSRSNSNSDLSTNKVASDLSSVKKTSDKNSTSTSFTIKLPSDRLASIKTQLDPNNPIGKILEKSTVIKVANGDADCERKKTTRNGLDTAIRTKDSIKSGVEKQIKVPKHTSNFASYIQISQPVVSGSPLAKTKLDANYKVNGQPADKSETQDELRNGRVQLKYIDSDQDEIGGVRKGSHSPIPTGFENKTFEHENFLKKRNGHLSFEDREGDGAKSMETSTDSATSDLTDRSSPEPSCRSKISARVDKDEPRMELAGGRSSAPRRSSESAEPRAEPTAGLRGLRNIGNTCFLNSVVQCLSNTRPLLEYVRADAFAPHINTSLSGMKGALIEAFASVIKELWGCGPGGAGGAGGVVNTSALKNQVQRFAPRFMGYSQQDAQEFLRYLLEGLHEDVNRVTVKPPPILTEIDDKLSESAKAAEAWARYVRREDSRVGDIFVGQLKSTLRCTHCGGDSVTFDPFWDLSLPIPARAGPVRLHQCLQHFTREEELDGDEKPTCGACGVRRKCLKWFAVHKFPQILVIHLKRFSPTERFRGKLNVLVEFPLEGLDMSPYASPAPPAAPPAAPPVYNLYAVSNHSGTTYSGHYTAYCKHPYTGAWHEYNDSRVSAISARDVVSSEAYVLFYEMQRA